MSFLVVILVAAIFNSNRLRQVFNMLKIHFITFNLFKNPNKRSNKQLQKQRLSTRCFIFLIIITLVILLIYTFTENVTQSVTIKNPSISLFNLLRQKYPGTVQCPCSKTLSIEYQNFISIQLRLHSVCSSDFTNPALPWFKIDYPLKLGEAPTFRTQIDDFRHIAGPFFQMLFFYCELSLQTLRSVLLLFNSTNYITPNLVSIEQFRSQTNQFIHQFQESTAQSFISSLNLINNMTHANALVSGLLTDSTQTFDPQYYYTYDGNKFDHIYDYRDQEYNSSGIMCNCQETSYCIQQAVVYDLNTASIYVGCFIAEAVLRSDLRCFFDSAGCLTQLTNALGIMFSTNISSLSNSSLSRYTVNTPLLDIVSNIMVEEWSNVTSYDNYFNECKPSLCAATYVSRGNLVYSITTAIKLIGGLNHVYRFLVPLFVFVTFRVIISYIRQ
ncbi:unnamed protein product [Adineta ricciae]|uniref:Uncharacterized protein n=1 Tax=Adineta ricciae TaxID=249248 RepID=A0A815VPQ9_ADIRI|nr:unnamed protein product [Adineta ricciae]